MKLKKSETYRNEIKSDIVRAGRILGKSSRRGSAGAFPFPKRSAKAGWRRRPFTAGCGSTGWQTCRENSSSYRKVYLLTLALLGRN